MTDPGCHYSYPSFGEYGVQHGTVLRCDEPTSGRLFNWPVGAEDAVQVSVCELHADMLGKCLQDAANAAPSEASPE